MGNNLENKAKYFAQHWGQIVFTTIGEHGLFKMYKPDVKYGYLVLKPISSITDEDAIHCANIMGLGLAWGYDAKIDWIKNWLTTKANITGVVGKEAFRISIEIYQYLISKGYALPFMGLSVEKLIEYGWLKLKTD